MNPIFEIYNLIFYQPVLKTLFFFYKYLKDFGLSVISLTILIRTILFPLDYKNSKERERFLEIEKKVKEINKKFDGEKKIKEILALYKKEKINPFFSFLSLFIQLPILIALYQVFLKATNQIDPSFFGTFDLSKPNLILVLIVILLQIFYLKMSSPPKSEKTISLLQNQINLFLIPFTFLILMKIPSAISLYLITSYFFLIFQKILFHV